MRRAFEYGGIIASVVLIVAGTGAIVVGFSGRDRVRDDLAREKIVGTPDSSIPGQLVDTGKEAEAFSATMRKHSLEATDGRTYAEMGRFIYKNGKETNDEKLAAKDPQTGQPAENGARTALNVAYFAERVSEFAMLMGLALLLTGIGFLVLTLTVLRREARVPEPSARAEVAPTTN